MTHKPTTDSIPEHKYETFCRWVNQVQYTGCFALWVKTIAVSSMLDACYDKEYDSKRHKEFELWLAEHRFQRDSFPELLQHFLRHALSAMVPEEAEFMEFLEAEWKPVSNEFAAELFVEFLNNSPMKLEDEEDDDPMSVKNMFPVSDALKQDFETIRTTIFDQFHTTHPFAFFSNIETTDILAEYDENVPSLIGANGHMIFLAWMN